jgi:hypothetical protein
MKSVLLLLITFIKTTRGTEFNLRYKPRNEHVWGKNLQPHSLVIAALPKDEQSDSGSDHFTF